MAKKVQLETALGMLWLSDSKTIRQAYCVKLGESSTNKKIEAISAGAAVGLFRRNSSWTQIVNIRT